MIKIGKLSFENKSLAHLLLNLHSCQADCFHTLSIAHQQDSVFCLDQISHLSQPEWKFFAQFCSMSMGCEILAPFAVISSNELIIIIFFKWNTATTQADSWRDASPLWYGGMEFLQNSDEDDIGGNNNEHFILE